MCRGTDRCRERWGVIKKTVGDQAQTKKLDGSSHFTRFFVAVYVLSLFYFSSLLLLFYLLTLFPEILSSLRSTWEERRRTIRRAFARRPAAMKDNVEE